MSTTEGQLSLLLAGSETLTAAEAPSGSTSAARTLKTGGSGIERKTLNSASTPKVDKPIAAFLITGTSGSPTTIDLTAVQRLTMPIGSTANIDLTGAKLKAWCFAAGGSNVGTVTVGPGASNPYPVYGTSKDIILDAGRVDAGSFKDVESALPAVSGTAKTLKFTFSNTGDTIYVELWAGT